MNYQLYYKPILMFNYYKFSNYQKKIKLTKQDRTTLALIPNYLSKYQNQHYINFIIKFNPLNINIEQLQNIRMSNYDGHIKSTYFNHQNKNNIKPTSYKIEEQMKSYRDSFQISSHMINSYDDNQEQILFLKDKLIQTHSKLMGELQNNKHLQAKIKDQDEEIKELREEVRQLKQEIYQYKRIQQEVSTTNIHHHQRYKSVQTKWAESQKKQQVLRSDLDQMRKKMLKVLVQKNQFQQKYEEIRQTYSKEKDKFEHLHNSLRQKDSENQYLIKQVEALKLKYSQADIQLQQYEEQVHKISSLLTAKTVHQTELDHNFKVEKDKNGKLIQQIMSIQSEHKTTLNRTKQLEEQCNQLKDDIYWFQNNKDDGKKVLNDQLQKLTQQLNTMTSLYRQKQREIDTLKKKPGEQAERKRRHFQHTKQFVRTLESQQTQRVHSKQNQALAANPITHLSATNRSQFYNSRSVKRNQEDSSPKPKTPKSPINSNKHNSIQRQNKSKYISLISEVGELQTALLNSNLERKKIVSEIDRIDETKVKTRDIIGKRKRLEEQLTYQDNKINKIKEELRKMRVM